MYVFLTMYIQTSKRLYNNGNFASQNIIIDSFFVGKAYVSKMENFYLLPAVFGALHVQQLTAMHAYALNQY